MTLRALTGALVFDGATLREGCVVLGRGAPRITTLADVPQDMPRAVLAGGVVMPGFVDLQVNGGGGVLLNDAPGVEGLRTIAQAHHGLGTRGLLPTLITDTPEQTRAAIDAAVAAITAGVPGVLGLHLEGPHLDPRRKGAHSAALIRPMSEADLTQLCDAAARLPTLLVTLAPEAATPAQIKTLSQAGARVFLGHTDADYDTALRAFEAGALGATHLFNAMSGLASRAPGVVGAALTHPNCAAGVIADAVHVHPAALRTATAASAANGGNLFLVSDAMAVAGTALDSFELNGRRITRADGRLTLEDGTLAGADLSLARAIEVMVTQAGDPLETALARATALPAAVLRDARGCGAWPDDARGLIHLSADFRTVTAAEDL